jgi:hypothetical protein
VDWHFAERATEAFMRPVLQTFPMIKSIYTPPNY